MILRERPGGGVLAVGQPDHAALAGCLAEAWDDELPPGLLVAAEHHDDVWAERDAAPPLAAATGRPETFLELTDAEGIEVWQRAPAVAAPLGPAAELWILRHAVRLHADYDEAAVKAMVAAFSARADALAAELDAAGPGFDDAALARGTSLLALFDTLSLRLCFGVGEPVAAGVLRLTPLAADTVAVAPWPFAARRVETFVLGRDLPARVGSQAELDAAWAATEPRAVPVTLVPA